MPRETVKDKIVRTAETLFYQQGYNTTGIDQVIEEADIARGSLYYHFDSKTDLLLACLDTYQQAWYEGLQARLQKISDPKKRVLALFDHRIDRQEKMGFGGCLFIKINDEAGKTDHRVLKKVRENKDKLKELLRELVGQSGHRQLLADEELVQLIFFLLEGSVVSTSIYKDSGELKKAKKIVNKFL
jgi:AcrR family transcriptional regulator